MAVTGNAFYEKTINKAIDVDKAYGGQCWDLWSYHQQLNNIPVINTSTTGYVRDIWNDRARNGVLTNYEAITDINKLQDGDWVIVYDKTLYPYSHIFMFRKWTTKPNAIMLGQNQRGGQKVTQEEWNIKQGFLGAFRLKATASAKAYEAHVMNDGWKGAVELGETAGTTGQNKRLEALKIFIPGFKSAKLHIQNIGWKTYTGIGSVLGTVGQKLRIEDVILDIPGYEFRVHQQNTGWTSWTNCDGISSLGSVGQSLQLEAIQIRKKK